MRIEISNITHGSLVWDMPDDFNKSCVGLPAESQETIKQGITKMLDEYFLFVTTALMSGKDAAAELEKVWQMQKLLMSEVLKGNIVFTPKDQLGNTH